MLERVGPGEMQVPYPHLALISAADNLDHQLGKSQTLARPVLPIVMGSRPLMVAMQRLDEPSLSSQR
jgi:hypothetical protein